MTPIADHPLRYALSNELHARPFPVVGPRGRAVFLAIKPDQNAASRDRDLDRAHLLALLDRYGAPHPQPGATHYFGEIGKHRLKWESHTEFTTYTVFSDGVSERAFDPANFEVFPDDWLATAPGMRITSALIHIEEEQDDARIAEHVDDWFVVESVTVSRVLDDAMVVAGDFRIDEAGHVRLALFPRPGVGERRIGRVLQRLCEIETYKTMSMLGLQRARQMNDDMRGLDVRLSQLVAEMNSPEASADQALSALLGISAQLENMLSQSAFRFGATGAYEALVNQRVEVLRESRFQGRQTFAEFMMRRFDPAMRTVKSTEKRLQSMAERAMRGSELLRTRVDVERSAQNQELLASMDRRADLQLRLQETVEGLSVVAISYYAVSLAGYLTYPLAEYLHISKGTLIAFLTVPVIAAVWLMVRRIRNHVG